MRTFFRDLRVGLRVLRKEKTFSTLSIGVIALGICGVTTMFSVVDGVMLRGFSFPNANRLAAVNFVDPTTATVNGVNGQVSSMDFQEMLPIQQSFERLAGYLDGSTVNITIDGRPKRLTGSYATAEFFRVLGVTPAMGRDFTAADDTAGAPKVAIISDGLWQREFGAAPDIVGKAVRINGRPATIVGVMPAGFVFPTNEELWVPLFNEYPPTPRNQPAVANPTVMGLLKPGVTIDRAAAEMTTVARRFAEAYPDTNKPYHTGQVKRLIESFTPVTLRGTLWTMLAFCVGVLLIACVNVMNMQFARATLRARELAVRSSLGGSRGRLLRQMLTESLLVALFGAAVGIALAVVSIDWLSSTVHNLENPPPAWMTFDLDAPVLLFTIGATLVAAVVSGLLPAWMSSRADAMAILREGGRGSTSRAVTVMSRGLVVVQIVVTCVLLVGSLLQVRSIRNQQTVDYGYDTGALLTARMGLMDGDYPTSAARKAFYDRLLEQLSASPEFAGAAFTNRFRMLFSGAGPIEVEGGTYRDKRDRPITNFEQVTPAFFQTLGQRLLQGRALTDADSDARQPVAVVNERFAHKYFGAQGAVGRRFRTANPDGTQPGPWRTIVGVVSDVRMTGPFNNTNVDDTGFYVSFYDNPFGPASADPVANQFATVVLKPRGGQPPDGLAASLMREVAKADPNLPLYFVGTPQSQIDGFVAQNRIIATLFSIFGAVAVVLAAVGLYGVMSFSVNQRRQEFGVRMALGASTRRVLGMVLRQGGVQVALGLVVGFGLTLALAAAGGEGIQATLFGVSAFDPPTYTVVFLLVAVVSLISILLPARRATRVDPMVALRTE